MAIDSLYLQLLAKAIETQRAAGSAGAGRRLSALALAYPDLLVPKAQLEHMFGAALIAQIPQRDDADAIKAWHGLSQWGDPIYDSIDLFDRLGIDVTVTDVAVLRGMERILDLNEPLPEDLAARFDLVIDTGTCEHCFNVGMAFRNTCEAVAVGGFLVHAAPMTRVNHGFWNFSPTVYPDYFGDNGFRLLYMNSIAGSIVTGLKEFPVDAFSAFAPEANAALYVVAQREMRKSPVWPVQRKYRGVIKTVAPGAAG